MDDLISRHAAIDAIDSVLVEDESCKVWFRLALQNLPSAQPERKRGKWIRQDNKGKPLYGWYQCSECGAVIGGKANFCSECGADMRWYD